MSVETITLGAGCFWCVENIFNRIKGVTSVISGYADGDTENPTYEQVCSGATNYAEVIQVSFDKKLISLEQLLEVFFAVHDPTTIDRQGDDIGSQYRSTILYHSEQQKLTANNKINTLVESQQFENSIVTKVTAVNNFHSAESYHQDYVNNNPENRYCQLVVARKIQKFITEFEHLLKS